MKNLMIALALLFTFYGFQNKPSQENATKETLPENVIGESQKKYGEDKIFNTFQTAQDWQIKVYGNQKMTLDNVVSGQELIEQLKTQDSVQIKVQAKVVDVCQKKGCWMDIQLNDTTTMLVRFKNYGFFVPMDCKGKTATIEGVAKVVILSEEWRKHKAEDAGSSAEEIDLITGSKTSYSIQEATGVILQ